MLSFVPPIMLFIFGVPRPFPAALVPLGPLFQLVLDHFVKHAALGMPLDQQPLILRFDLQGRQKVLRRFVLACL